MTELSVSNEPDISAEPSELPASRELDMILCNAPFAGTKASSLKLSKPFGPNILILAAVGVSLALAISTMLSSLSTTETLPVIFAPVGLGLGTTNAVQKLA